MVRRARVRCGMAAFILAGCLTATTLAADPPQVLLENFNHYVLTANVELALGNAQALIDSGVSNAELAQLLDEGKVSLERFERAISKAARVPELEATANDLANRVEMGRMDLCRDPKRIEEAIKMLGGVQRGRLIAEKRLECAGEYAVPALLKTITDGNDEVLKLAAGQMLTKIGRQAVTPLCEALQGLGPAHQRIVCDLLGDIGHPHANPYLARLAADDSAGQPIRESAQRAFSRLRGEEKTVSTQFAELARRYYEEQESLIAFAGEPTNNVWAFDAFVGLVATPVPTEVYGQVMAMRLSSIALVEDRTNADALSLYVAANLKRENDLPEGASDPIFGTAKYTPDFYATVFGTQTCLDVLSIAVNSKDTPLVRDAIAALSKTTGGSNLFARSEGSEPLLAALNYPDRRVQVEAALTLAKALPSQGFNGDHQVVPLLASAVRTGNRSFAVIIADNEEDRGNHASALQKLGFEIVGSGSTVEAVRPDMGRAIGVDLVIIRKATQDSALKTLVELRNVPKAEAAPTLVIASATDIPALTMETRTDRRVVVARAGVGAESLEASVEEVMKSGAGGRITEAESEEYAILALGALRDIAISRNTVYTIADAEGALLDALDTRTGGTRMKVADILSMIDSDRAQRKLFDAAFAASPEDQVELLNRVAESVKRFGDRAEKRHVESLLELVANSTGETAEAAATVHGAMNMSASDAVDLIPR